MHTTVPYVMKMSLHRGWVAQKSLKTSLLSINMAPLYCTYSKIVAICTIFLLFVDKVEVEGILGSLLVFAEGVAFLEIHRKNLL